MQKEKKEQTREGRWNMEEEEEEEAKKKKKRSFAASAMTIAMHHFIDSF